MLEEAWGKAWSWSPLSPILKLLKYDKRPIYIVQEKTKVSLDAVKHGKAGLDKRRKGLLDRVPNQGDDAEVKPDSLDIKDLACVKGFECLGLYGQGICLG